MNELASFDQAGAAAQQPDLPLDAPPLPPGAPLLPARMINEYTYCPRLAYLEWVQGEWAESADTVEGRHVHKRVDKASGKPPGKPPAAGAAEAVVEERIHVTSLELSSDTLGIIAKLDLAEFEGRRAVPVDYKRGKRPHVPRHPRRPRPPRSRRFPGVFAPASLKPAGHPNNLRPGLCFPGSGFIQPSAMRVSAAPGANLQGDAARIVVHQWFQR